MFAILEFASASAVVQLPVVSAVKADFENGFKIYIYIAVTLLLLMAVCSILMLMKAFQKTPKWIEKRDMPELKGTEI